MPRPKTPRPHKEQVLCLRAADQYDDWNDHEKLFMCFMLIVMTEAKQWNTEFYMHAEDFRCLMGLSGESYRWDKGLESIRRVFRIGLVGDTISIHMKESYARGTGKQKRRPRDIPSQCVHYITDTKAIAKYWFLCGRLLPGTMLSDFTKGEQFFKDDAPMVRHHLFKRIKLSQW